MIARAGAVRLVRKDEMGAVLLLDLDDFKGVNDVYGHLIGDQLLVSIAHRFEKVTARRTRFAALVRRVSVSGRGLTSPGEAEKIAERLLGALANPSLEDYTSSSAPASDRVWDGASTTTKASNSSKTLTPRCTRPSAGTATGRLHSEIRQETLSRFALIHELRHAVASGELQMHYQPIIDLSTSDVVGFEH